LLSRFTGYFLMSARTVFPRVLGGLPAPAFRTTVVR